MCRRTVERPRCLQLAIISIAHCIASLGPNDARAVGAHTCTGTEAVVRKDGPCDVDEGVRLIPNSAAACDAKVRGISAAARGILVVVSFNIPLLEMTLRVIVRDRDALQR